MGRARPEIKGKRIMRITKLAVPYDQRLLTTSTGTVVIWPFLNVERGDGPFELFLDTNSLNNAKWFGELPVDVRSRCVINPWPALLEQWLSNPKFRANAGQRMNTERSMTAEQRIEAMLKPFVEMGTPFRENFASQQVHVLTKNEAALKSQFSLIMPYVAIMKSTLAERVRAEEALQRLEALAKLDIPRITSAMMLSAMTTLLKSKQALKLEGGANTAYSYLESFFAFHPGKKDEQDFINVPYLRNRAGDLNLWLSLSLLSHQGYPFVGSPAIVTGDKALHRLIVRAIPPAWREDRQVSFALAPDGLPEPMIKQIGGILEQVDVRTSVTGDETLMRVTNLFEYAKACCGDERARLALDEIYLEWWLPGFGKKIDLS